MKKILFLVMFTFLLGGLAQATSYHYAFPPYKQANPPDNYKHLDDWILGAKFDAPNIIRLNQNWTIGAEVFKDFLQTDINQGWGAFGKVTWTGTFFDFSKKETKIEE